MARKPYIVGIVGGKRIGQDIVSCAICSRVCRGSRPVALLSQDNYYRLPSASWSAMPRGFPNFDLPTAIHRDHFFDDMCSPGARRNHYPDRIHLQSSRTVGNLITVEPAEVLIMEGLFVFHNEEIRALLDLRVFFDASDGLCKERRMQRDARERRRLSAGAHRVSVGQSRAAGVSARYVLPHPRHMRLT